MVLMQARIIAIHKPDQGFRHMPEACTKVGIDHMFAVVLEIHNV